MTWQGTYRTEKTAYRILVGECERKRPLGRLRHRGEDKIKINFKCHGNEWTGLIWLRAETRSGPK